MAVWRRITTDPEVAAVAMFVIYYALQVAFDVGWPFTIAYAAAGCMAIKAIQRRVSPDPGREAEG